MDAMDSRQTAGTLTSHVRAVVQGYAQSVPCEMRELPNGDLSVQAGSAMVLIRVRTRPLVIDVCAPLLADVQATVELYASLSKLTSEMTLGRVYYSGATIWISVPILGERFQPKHLLRAIMLARLFADHLDDELRGRFGGRRYTDNEPLPAPPSAPPRIGMYL
jgi:hypothetical protein